ncbi:hypothetical protein HPB52_002185 [Rhipicephalus sanguineus]|uniref:THAP-type domain-containing protein n=1 Tax=Rhipicephalus sanguineus TaxID=34632 RepID=A0A9D4PEF9_RHISA|nr:hypothetical protein HPB52_002185 [Rhipicephalus sanguineus]
MTLGFAIATHRDAAQAMPASKQKGSYRFLALQKMKVEEKSALEENCAVCELHFEDRYILREYVHIIDGKEVRIAHGVPALTPDAVPTVLPNAPKYLSTKLPPKRAPCKREAPTVPGPQNSKKACTSTPVDEDFESQGDVHDVSTAAAGAPRHARSQPIQFARSAPYSVNECRLSKSALFVMEALNVTRLFSFEEDSLRRIRALEQRAAAVAFREKKQMVITDFFHQ